MLSCVVPNCINHEGSNRDDSIAEQFSYHPFPDDPDLLEKWVKEINQESLELTADSTVCSLHFNKDCFITDADGVEHLKGDAIPTLFEFETIMETDGVDVLRCCAPNCLNVYQEDSVISFHQFPVESQDLCDQWLMAMNVDQLAADSAVLCSDHFDDSCFIDGEDGQRLIVPNAVPSIFNFTNGDATETADEPVDIVDKHDGVVTAMNEASGKLMELFKQRTELEKARKDLDALLRVVVGGSKLDRNRVKSLTTLIRSVDEIAQQVVVDCLAPCVALPQPLQPVTD